MTNYDRWLTILLEFLPEEFWNANEEWLCEGYPGKFNDWAVKLYEQGKSTDEAADIIQKAHSIHINRTR